MHRVNASAWRAAPENDVSELALIKTANLAAQRDVLHGFTTRSGGVSEGALAGLNLARRAGEDEERLTENWRRVLRSLHPGLRLADLALLDQVHGADVITVNQGAGPLATVGAADGAVTTEKGVVLAVRTADCVPVLFRAPGGVGVAHAGWRGVAAGVVARTAQRLRELTSTPPDTWQVAIGPCISASAYETGEGVVDAIVEAGVPREVVAWSPPGGGRLHADLVSAVRHQLECLGIGDVAVVGRCTATDDALFSHRADGPQTGRLAGVIARCP